MRTSPDRAPVQACIANHTWMRRALPALAMTALLAVCSAPAKSAPNTEPTPPPAPIQPAVDRYHGVDIVDPYRWLEDLSSPQTQGWIKAQAEYADRYLQALPGRQSILDDLQQPRQPGALVRMIQRRGEAWFYLRRLPDANHHVLVVRETPSAPEQVLVDPARLGGDGETWSIDSFSASPDGRHVVYMVSSGGREAPDLHLYDRADGSSQDLDVPYALAVSWLPDRGASWLPDGSGFFYSRYPAMGTGAEATQRQQNAQTWLHRLDRPDHPRRVLGASMDPAVAITPDRFAHVLAPGGSDWLIARIDTTSTAFADWYVAPRASLADDRIAWHQVASVEDQVSAMSARGETLYLLSARDAPNFRVLATTGRQPRFAEARVVVPESDAVLQSMVPAADALYLQTSEIGLPRIARFDYDTGTSRLLPAPEGAVTRLIDQGNDASRSGIAYQQRSFTSSASFHHYDVGSGRSTPVPLAEGGASVEAEIASVVTTVTSHDGAEVPMVILHRRGIARDGSHPVLLTAYGAYGMVYIDPSGWPSLDALEGYWREGFIIAVAGVRGGGERGADWHLAGKQATKPNTWKDLIASAEYLVASGYTRPERLAAMGGSAGGITVGNAIVERPDLFAAALIDVGVTNPLRFETTANGIPNIGEFGSTQTREGFDALLAMDAFHKVRDGVAYPAVLLSHGYNDPRVDAWLSAKFAARLQAASSSGKPVLLRINYDAGHFGIRRDQVDADTADTLAFLRRELGLGDPPAGAVATAGAHKDLATSIEASSAHAMTSGDPGHPSGGNP